MALTHGMNVESVLGIADRLSRASHQLDTIRSTTDRLTQDAVRVWTGSDSRSFAAEWSSHFRPGVVSAAQSIEGLAKSARINADQQVDASGVGVVGGVRVGAVGGSGIGLGGALAPYGAAFGLAGAGGRAIDGVHDLAEVQVPKLAKVDEAFFGRLGKIAAPLGLVSDLGDLAADPTNPHKWLDASSGALNTASQWTPEWASKVLGKAAGVVQVGNDVSKAVEYGQAGNPAAAAYYGVHAGVAGIGVVVKPVALGLAAWDVGVEIGTALGEAYNKSDLGQAEQQSTVDWGLQMIREDPRYAGADPGSLITERYSGAQGVFNMFSDSVQSKAYNLGTWMSGGK